MLLLLLLLHDSARATHATEMNSVSSRSHAVCDVIIREPSGKLHGKLSLVDLAGSERATDTKNHNRQRRMEGAAINQSLLALKECVRCVCANKKERKSGVVRTCRRSSRPSCAPVELLLWLCSCLVVDADLCGGGFRPQGTELSRQDARAVPSQQADHDSPRFVHRQAGARGDDCECVSRGVCCRSHPQHAALR